VEELEFETERVEELELEEAPLRQDDEQEQVKQWRGLAAARLGSGDPSENSSGT
jgi:hypothetical protein